MNKNVGGHNDPNFIIDRLNMSLSSKAFQVEMYNLI